MVDQMFNEEHGPGQRDGAMQVQSCRPRTGWTELVPVLPPGYLTFHVDPG